MTLDTTLSSHESITSDEIRAARSPLKSERIIDEEIVKLSGGLFDTNPFVERPLDDYFPQLRTTARRARRSRGSIPHQRHLDEEVIHLSGYLFDLPASDKAPRGDLPATVTNALDPAATPSDPFIPVARDLLPESLAPRRETIAPASLPAAGSGLRVKVSLSATAVVFGAAGALGATLLQGSGPASTSATAMEKCAAIVEQQAEALSVPREGENARTKPAMAVAEAATAQAMSASRPAKRPSLARAAAGAEKAAVTSAAETEAKPKPAASEVPFEATQPAAQTVDSARAGMAIAAAARGAGACLKPGSGSRSMSVSVRFAPSGMATLALVENGTLRGTPAASCVAQHLRSARVNAFDGPPVTVRTRITLR